MTACPNCGTEASPGDRFCQACGYPLATAGTPPPPPLPDLGEWPDAGDPGLSMPIPMPPPPPVVVPPAAPYGVYLGYHPNPAATPYRSPSSRPSSIPYALPSAPLPGYPAGTPTADPAGAFASFAQYQPAPLQVMPPLPPARTRDGPPATAQRLWIAIAVVVSVCLVAAYLLTRGGIPGATAPTLTGTWYGPLAVATNQSNFTIGYAYFDLRQANNGTITGAGASCGQLLKKDGIKNADLTISGLSSPARVNLTVSYPGGNLSVFQFAGTWSAQTINLTYQQPTFSGSPAAGTLTMSRGAQSAYAAACQHFSSPA